VPKLRGGAFALVSSRTVVAMGYAPRIEVPYGYYHVVTRGNNRRTIYADDRDRELFLMILARVARRYGWSFLAYCLMGNHYHFVLQLAEAGISRGMCELNTAYAATNNLRHGRADHVFGRRFLERADHHGRSAPRHGAVRRPEPGPRGPLPDVRGLALEQLSRKRRPRDPRAVPRREEHSRLHLDVRPPRDRGLA
jgi:REP element-mobilizing transposase RayT